MPQFAPKHFRLTSLYAFGTLLFFSLSAAALASPNDLCSDATVLQCGDVVSGSTQNATTDNAGTCTVDNNYPGVWYQFTGDNSTVTLSTCGSVGIDTRISVFEGSCGALVCVAGDDNSGPCMGFASELAFQAATGTEYYILVHQAGPQAGTINLSISCDPAQNDLCTDAIPMTLNSLYEGTTVGSSVDPVATCSDYNGNYRNVWYSFVGDGNPVEFSLCDATNSQYQIGIFSGSCGALSCETGFYMHGGCNSSAVADQFNTTNGVQYYVAVGPRSSSTSGLGEYALWFGPSTAPVNNDCSGAISLNYSDTVYGNTNSATVGTYPGSSASCASQWSTTATLWYTFVATSTAVSIYTANAGLNTEPPTVELAQGDCASLACYQEDNGTYATVPGNTYSITVRQPNPYNESHGFHLAITAINAPANDHHFNAINVQLDDVETYDLTGATPFFSYKCCSDIHGMGNPEDVWYQFNGTGGFVRIRELGGDADIELYSGTCLLANLVAENNAYQYDNFVTGSFVPTALDTTYYIRVMDGTAGAFVVEDVYQAANSDCASAITVTSDSDIDLSGVDSIGGYTGPTVDCSFMVGNQTYYWYHFAGNDSTVQILSYGLENVLEGNCANATCVENLSYASSSVTSPFTFHAEAGKDYYVVLKHFTNGFSLTCSAPYPDPPANDHCSTATVIHCGDSLDGTLVNANSLSSYPFCFGSTHQFPVVFYKTTGTGDAFTVRATGAWHGLQLSVLDGCSGSPTCVTGNQQSGNFAQTTWNTTAGVDYWIAIKPSIYNETGDFTIELSCGPAAPVLDNDSCVNAIPIACGDLIHGSNEPATQQGDQTCETNYYLSRVVWYSFTGTGDMVEIGTPEGQISNWRHIWVQKGTCASTTCVEEVRTSSSTGITASLTFLSEVGENYLIAVGNNYTGYEFDLEVRCEAPPSNGSCATAATLTCGDDVNGTVAVGASATLPNCEFIDTYFHGSSLYTGPTVWYEVVGTGDRMSFEVDSAEFRSSVFIYEGGCGSSICADAYSDATGAHGRTVTMWETTPGTVYSIAVMARNLLTRDGPGFTARLRCESGVPAITCADAIPVGCGSTTFQTAFADGASACNFDGGIGQWFVMAGNGQSVTVDPVLREAAGRGRLRVFTGNCNNLECFIAYVDNRDNATFKSVVGTDYYFYVGGEPGHDATLEITCTSPVDNDWCEDAYPLICGVPVHANYNGYGFNDLGACATNSSSTFQTSNETGGIWYSFTGDDSWVAANMAYSSSGYPAYIRVYSGSCNNLVCEAKTVNTSPPAGFEPSVTTYSNKKSVAWFAAAGTEYRIYVWGRGVNSYYFDLELQCIPPLANSTCGAALPIQCGNTYSGNTFAPFSTASAICTATGRASGNWYTFVGDGSDATLTTCSGSFTGAQISVFSGTCGSFSCEAISAPKTGCAAGAQEVTFSTDGGTTYYVFVHSDGENRWGEYLLYVDCACTIVSGISALSSTCGTGSANGQVSTVPANGTTPYTYAWSSNAGSATTSVVNGLYGGTYTVTISDADGCALVDSISIASITNMTATLSGSNGLCAGDPATAMATPANGTPPYTYAWSDPLAQTGSTASNLAGGTYTTTVQDSEGCTATGSIVLVSGSEISVLSATVTGTTCGGSNGSIAAAVSGGAAPYTWQWDAAAGSSTATSVSNLFAGSYQAVVTSVNGCTTDSVFIVPQQTGINSTQTQLAAQNCGSTLSTLNQYFGCSPVAGAQRYEFELIAPGGAVSLLYSLSSAAATVSTQTSFVYLPGATYGTTYDVRVRAKVGGCWGSYGPVCQLSTPTIIPATQLAAAYCNTTVASLTDIIYCVPVPGAERYQYEFTDGGTVVTGFSHSSNPSSSMFRFHWLPGIDYSTIYSVRVRAKVNGIWGTYGPACGLTTPAPPMPQLQAAYCNTVLPSLSSYVYAMPVVGAQRYAYEITDAGSFNYLHFSYWAAPTSTWMSLAHVPGIQPSTTYNVRVMAKIAGVWGAYGPSCALTTPAASAKTTDNLLVQAYQPTVLDAAAWNVQVFPNPASSNFTVRAEALTSAEYWLECYDMQGRLMYRELVPTNGQRIAHRLDVARNWPRGLYTIRLFDEWSQTSKRMVLQ